MHEHSVLRKPPPCFVQLDQIEQAPVQVAGPEVELFVVPGVVLGCFVLVDFVVVFVACRFSLCLAWRVVVTAG